MPDAPSRPFAVDNHELQQIETFCAANKLDVLGRICAELRVLRAEYLRLSERVGRQKATMPQSPLADNQRFAATLDSMTSFPKEDLECPVNPSKDEEHT